MTVIAAIAQAPTGDSRGAAERRSLFKRRFMRRLSIGVKLWSATAVLAVPVVGLGIFYVNSLTSTLWFTSTELRGTALAFPLVEFGSNVGRHAALEAVALTQGSSPTPEMQKLTEELDGTLAALRKLEASDGNEVTHRELRAVEQTWATLQSTKPASIKDSVAVHTAVLDAVFAMTSQVATDWQLILDPELTAYNLLDVAVTKMPDIQRALSRTQAGLLVMYSKNEYVPTEGAGVIASASVLDDRLGAARDELKAAADGAALRPQLAEQIARIGTDWNSQATQWLAKVLQEMNSGHPREEAVHALMNESVAIPTTIAATWNRLARSADLALQIRYAHQLRTAELALSSSALALIVSVLLMLALVRRIAGAIRRLLGIADAIAEGKYDARIDEEGEDEISRLFAGVASMQRKLKLQTETDRAHSTEIGRIKCALDNASSSVMVADENNTIIYVNEAALMLCRSAQADFRQNVPDFDPQRLVGTSTAALGMNLSSGRQAAEGLKDPSVADMRVGNRVLRTTASPVFDSDGKRVGTVVEWFDRTQEVRAEEEVGAIVRKALEGDLESRVRIGDKSGFFQVLGHGLNDLLDNMCAMVRQIQTAATEVQRGAEEISQGNANLSERTAQQSASLEETASSMEEMTSTVQQNADNAGHATQLASTAREQAEKGGAVVGNAMRAMADINNSSKRIGDIIGVIDDIAFQTNLLALNAAVEAARAGEQGRGFAVVATEVRSLAGRSATAAKEIKHLIQDSVKKIEDGSVLVTECGATLEQIVASVKKVSDIVAEIAAAGREQSSGIELVNRAVMQMDEMTQQNAALVEQATAASQSMAEQARELSMRMQRYRLELRDRTALPAPTLAHPRALTS